MDSWVNTAFIVPAKILPLTTWSRVTFGAQRQVSLVFLCTIPRHIMCKSAYYNYDLGNKTRFSFLKNAQVPWGPSVLNLIYTASFNFLRSLYKSTRFLGYPERISPGGNDTHRTKSQGPCLQNYIPAVKDRQGLPSNRAKMLRMAMPASMGVKQFTAARGGKYEWHLFLAGRALSRFLLYSAPFNTAAPRNFCSSRHFRWSGFVAMAM